MNIRTPFAISPFIFKNIVHYKGEPFSIYEKDREGKCLGKICTAPTQYAVKVYDKGLQFDLPYNLLRIETKFLKMQKLNKYSIYSLNDLQDYNKVNALNTLIYATWANVLVYDIPGKVRLLPISQIKKELLTNGRNFTYWKLLKDNGKDVSYPLQSFKNEVAKYGNNWHKIVSEEIVKEWKNLMRISQNLPTGKTTNFQKFTIKIKGKKLEKTVLPLERYCKSCRKKLNLKQKLNSKFCSAKYVGESEAHRCRNYSSNPKNNFIKKIETIQGRGVLFDIMPYFIPQTIPTRLKTL